MYWRWAWTRLHAGAGGRRHTGASHQLDPATNQAAHRNASFLPDGRSVPVSIVSRTRLSGLDSLDGTPPKHLLTADARAVFAPPDWVLFVHQNTLFAQRVDLARLKMLDQPRQIAEDVRTNEANGRSAFTVSSNGILVYRTGDRNQDGVLTWFDRSGNILGRVADSAARYHGGLGLLPDERHVVAHIHDEAQGGGDLWKIDLERGTQTKLTTHPAHDEYPVVSPDGAVAWNSTRNEARADF